MIRFLADENFSGRILDALRRVVPRDCVVRAQDVGLQAASDPDVLEWAAQNDRILLTRDIGTMRAFAYERIANGPKMTAIFMVNKGRVRDVVNDLQMIAECSEAEEWNDLIEFLPL